MALARLAAEACTGNGLEIASLSELTRRSLRDLDGNVVVDNPLLLLGASGSEDLAQALETVLADPGVDAVVTVFVPPLRDCQFAVAAVLSAVTSNASETHRGHHPGL